MVLSVSNTPVSSYLVDEAVANYRSVAGEPGSFGSTLFFAWISKQKNGAELKLVGSEIVSRLQKLGYQIPTAEFGDHLSSCKSCSTTLSALNNDTARKYTVIRIQEMRIDKRIEEGENLLDWLDEVYAERETVGKNLAEEVKNACEEVARHAMRIPFAEDLSEDQQRLCRNLTNLFNGRG